MVAAGRTLILPDVSFRARNAARDLGLMLAFSLLTAATAQFVIWLPFTEVPITGQTFGVLLTGALLGGWRGFGAMLLYLSEGMLGLPVFAPGGPKALGLAALLGPSGGYLIAFPFAALVVGLLAERGWDQSPRRVLIAMALGSAVIYAFGAPWLAVWLASQGRDPDGAVALGILPFLPGDALKAALAAAWLPLGARRLARR